VKPRHKTSLFLAFLSAAGVATALLVWGFLQPTERALPQVSFADFLADVRAGRVDDIHVDGDVYRFRVRRGAKAVEERSTGPTPDIAQVRAVLRPASPDLAAPKVYFDR